jgi:hypothetical protein
MQKLTFVLLLVLASACQQKEYYQVSNPGKKEATDLATVLTRREVNRFLPDTTTGLPVIVKDLKGQLVPSQCDDLDGDNQWDELVFLCNLGTGESKKLIFEPIEASAYPVFAKRTNLRFSRVTAPFETAWGDLRMKTNDTKFTAPVYQMEGPGWENDIVAFRNYYDARNGIDIYGKRVSEMVLDSVGLNGRNYHELADWGMDILKVGNSLGAGAIAIGIGDSLYRVGPCEEGRVRIISQGPVRSIFELIYKNVPAGDRFYSVKQQISIYAGDNFYRSSVRVNDLKGDEELVTGIVDMHGLASEKYDMGDKKAMSTWGKQTMNGEILGMAVIFTASEFKRYWEAPVKGPGVINTHLVSLALSSDKPTSYNFMTAWELRDEKLKDEGYFREVVKEAVARSR